MKRSLKKDFFREIKNSRNRFISIMLIVALGVAFYAGIRAAGPDMSLTADSYYDSSNLMDIRVLSTWGLEEADIALLEDIEGVTKVQPGYSRNVYGYIGDTQHIIQVFSMPETINQPTLVEGRMPEEKGECVIDEHLFIAQGYTVGQVITIESGDDTALSEMFAQDAFEIVGVVNSAYYLSRSRDSASFGDGTVDGYIYVPEEAFDSEVYTEVYLTVEGADQLVSGEDGYYDLVEAVEDTVEDALKERKDNRYSEVLQEAKEEIEENEKKLLDAEIEIADGEAALAEAKEELESNEQQAQREFADTKKQLEAYRQEYEDGVNKIAEGEAALNEAKSQLAEKEAGLIEQESALDAMIAALGENDPQVLAVAGMLTQARSELESAKAQLAVKEQEIEAGKAALETSRIQLEQGEQEYSAAVKRVNREIENGKEEIAEKEEELLDGKKEIEEGKEELEEAKAELLDLEEPEYYVLDRSSLAGCVEFEQDADRIDAIGKVFPAIFFIVAALVSLTTMTRMVESDRTQIGTLKALGYQNGQIAAKYICYALFATVIGSLFGMVVGQKLLPAIILEAYSMMYDHLPESLCPLNVTYSVTSTLLAIATTVLATIAACYKELVAVPAVLMRPVAPKKGKRVFLERIPFIWKKLSFTNKVTVRNLLRYKKLFFMTVFGIGGCMALLLVGFGVKDSIFSIINEQFGKVFLYDCALTINEDASLAELDVLQDYLDEHEMITDYLSVHMASGDVKTEEAKKTAYICVPKDVNVLSDYINLINRVSGETYVLDDTGVIISEKLASLLKVSVGDSITLVDEEEGNKQVTVTAIVENHLQHYVYMSPSLYEDLYGENVSYNQLLVNGNIEQENQMTEELLTLKAVEAVSMSADAKESVMEMLDSMNLVIAVLIVAAGALAFVVLYNLNNINITERKRELATSKVLGFYHM